jgi:protein-L-isoaspartate(D-aspartate) O-methyltransferase
MIETQILARGVKDTRVIDALYKVDRARFVPDNFKRYAYSDSPLPIESGQTISQPYMVAAMTEMLKVKPEHRILEIGTGTGYQTAILAQLAKQVYTVEILPELAVKARRLLGLLGYENISYRVGDGHEGWEENAPYDGILVAAAPTHVPKDLKKQLKLGGRLIIPVGPTNSVQELLEIVRTSENDFQESDRMSVRFVPLTKYQVN